MILIIGAGAFTAFVVVKSNKRRVYGSKH